MPISSPVFKLPLLFGYGGIIPVRSDAFRLAAHSRQLCAGWIFNRSEGETNDAADICNIGINKTFSWLHVVFDTYWDPSSRRSIPSIHSVWNNSNISLML